VSYSITCATEEHAELCAIIADAGTSAEDLIANFEKARKENRRAEDRS
jgi:hypothetical protein